VRQLVELKNGDTYNGHLVNCDTWMNVNLREVICTSKVRSSGWVWCGVWVGACAEASRVLLRL
jgi:small nuclear ribonucleoprotein (snRNP)-like protein